MALGKILNSTQSFPSYRPPLGTGISRRPFDHLTWLWRIKIVHSGLISLGYYHSYCGWVSEILHQLIPLSNYETLHLDGISYINHTYQLVQDFATIHRYPPYVTILNKGSPLLPRWHRMFLGESQ